MMFWFILSLPACHALVTPSFFSISNKLESKDIIKLHSSRDLSSSTISPKYSSSSWASINRGGPFNSFELYTSHRETQQLIISHIANWVRVEKSCDLLPKASSHSVIFASIDGERVVHNVGWKLDGLGLASAFKVFRNRADGSDGTPAGLKERYLIKSCEKISF